MKFLKRLLAITLTVCMLSGILIPNSLTVVHADSAASGGGGAGVGGGDYGVPGNPDVIETEAVNLQHGTGVVIYLKEYENTVAIESGTKWRL